MPRIAKKLNLNLVNNIETKPFTNRVIDDLFESVIIYSFQDVFKNLVRERLQHHNGRFLLTQYYNVKKPLYLSLELHNEYLYIESLSYYENDLKSAKRHFDAYEKINKPEDFHLHDLFPEYYELICSFITQLDGEILSYNIMIEKIKLLSIFFNFLRSTSGKMNSFNDINDELIIDIYKYYQNKPELFNDLKAVIKLISSYFNTPNFVPKFYQKKQSKTKKKGRGILALPSSLIYQLEYCIKQEYEELKNSYTKYIVKHERESFMIPYRNSWTQRPHSHDIYPLVLLLLIKHGINIEVLRSWKIKKYDGKYVLGDSLNLFTVIDGIKSRSNNVITTVIKNDSLEKKYIDLYLNIMNAKKLYEKYNGKYFFQYFGNGVLQDGLTKMFLQNIGLSPSSYAFYNKYEILDLDGNRIKKFNHKRLRVSHNYQQFLKGKTEYERQLKKNHKDGQTTLQHYENSAEWKGLKKHKIATTQNILVGIFKGKIIRSENYKTIKALKLFNGALADCKNNKNPTFNNAPKLKENQVCSDWTKCLTQCEQSCVIPKIHGEVIYAWIKYLEEMKEEFISIKDWEKEYLIDYNSAINTISHFTDEEKRYSEENAYKHREFVKLRFNRIIKVKEVI